MQKKSLLSAYNLLLSMGYQISPEAFNLLRESKDPEGLVNRLIKNLESMEEKPIIIERIHIESLLTRTSSEVLKPKSKETSHKIKVISGEESSYIEGKPDDFKRYFINRFERLRSFLTSRSDVVGACGPSGLNNKQKKVKVIGLVASKKETKDRIIIELEDFEGIVRVIFKDEAKKKASRVMMDQVICIFGNLINEGIILGEEVVWPDIIPRKRAFLESNSYVALTSDLHIGSKLFMKQEFESFLRWINGENDEKSIASKLKYLIIAGDIVDGVGIYPNQEEELIIKDIYRQYEEAAHYLSMIREDVKIIIIPGNHDACRQTLPTPPIYKDIGAPLYSLKNVIMLGDPAIVEIEGLIFLITHGRSLDDVIPALPDCSFREPQKAMAELLKSRHIAPIYGEKTPIAPEPMDRLVIDIIPDIFHAGHVHVWGVSEYKGVILANSGTWQKQTKYQMSMGIEPAPGVVPVIDISNFKVFTVKFL
ncbi:MAG: DNA-directed DNA polymerase II small subunit [Candidatus Methanomethyliaceae archaeon]|nr:DNA-directed DNA polymerase II small subunit [Candidatus Methanomethyliaceae archaeon]MDW7970480.1 DNA-directed DNA polymerase II small subunit [Nitrososphaerota archaeon]